MKKSAGRKDRRRDFYKRYYDAEKKTSSQDGHGNLNTLHAMGIMKPTIKTQTHPLTNKRIEMIRKHPERALSSEKYILQENN